MRTGQILVFPCVLSYQYHVICRLFNFQSTEQSLFSQKEIITLANAQEVSEILRNFLKHMQNATLSGNVYSTVYLKIIHSGTHYIKQHCRTLEFFRFLIYCSFPPKFRGKKNENTNFIASVLLRTVKLSRILLENTYYEHINDNVHKD